MSEWQKVQIGEVAEVFDGPHATPQKTSSGPIFLGITTLDHGRLNLSNTDHLSEEDFTKWTRRVTPRAGDVVFSYETRLGEAALIPEGLRCCLGRRMGLVRTNENKLDSQFFLYQYLSPSYQEFLRSRTVPGSTVDRIPLIDFPNFHISLPPLTEQRAIAHILGTLDDKIELNRRMNETLEAIARALFKSWFVDFDPVRAKMNGEPPDSICQRLGLTPDLLALFPDRLVDSELGEIPEGWETTTLQNMTVKIGSGATPRGGSEVYLDEGVALIRSQNVYDSNFVWEGLARISDEAAKQLAGVEVKVGDVLINITGASILRTCVVEPEVLPARVNQHVAIIRAKPEVSSRYIHLHLLQESTKAYLMNLNAGGSREAVTKGHLESVPILNPGTELLAFFQKLVAPIYAEIEQLSSQSRALMASRDTILPKLLSGELRVPDAEEALEA